MPEITILVRQLLSRLKTMRETFPEVQPAWSHSGLSPTVALLESALEQQVVDKSTTNQDLVFGEVHKLLDARHAIGVERYGISNILEDPSSTSEYWLQQALEEAADQLVYLQALKLKLAEKS